jgi:hypothetical protein
MRITRTAITTLVLAGALLAGSGAALADDGQGKGAAGTKQERCQRVAQRIAERQGLTVAQLEAKLRQRALDRIDAALKAGKLTEQQAASLRQRVNEWKLCAASVGGRHARHVHFAAVASMLAGAAHYLDLTGGELRSELKAGKSLGDIATAKGLSISGLKQAMLAKITARLDKAVTDGKLTGRRRDALLEGYGKLADRLIAKRVSS